MAEDREKVLGLAAPRGEPLGVDDVCYRGMGSKIEPMVAPF